MGLNHHSFYGEGGGMNTYTPRVFFKLLDLDLGTWTVLLGVWDPTTLIMPLAGLHKSYTKSLGIITSEKSEHEKMRNILSII